MRRRRHLAMALGLAEALLVLGASAALARREPSLPQATSGPTAATSVVAHVGD